MKNSNSSSSLNTTSLRVVDSILSVAIPIFLTSALSSAAVLINIAIVVGQDKTTLYYLGLFLPIYYAALAIQEGLRVPVLRFAASADKRNPAATVGRCLGFVIALLICGIVTLVVISWVGSTFFADLYKIPQADRSHVTNFIYSLLLASIVPGIASMILSALFGLGKSTIAGTIGITATAINVATAYICATYFNQGIYSIVWAAVIGGACLFFPALGVLLLKQRVFPTLKASFAQARALLSDIFSLSLPVSFSFIAIFGFLFVFNHLVAYYGTSEVAGFGVAFRIQSFVILPAIALGTAVAILINGAISSGKFPMIRQYFRIGIVLSFALYAIAAAAIFLFQEPLLRLFSSDPSEIEAGMRYLSVVAPSYLSFGPVLMLLTLLEQTGYGLRAMLVNIVFFSLELGFASVLGLQQPTASVLYLVIAAANSLAAAYLAFEVIQRMRPPKSEAPTVDVLADASHT